MKNYLIFKFRELLNHIKPYKDFYQDITADQSDLPKANSDTLK